MSKTFLIAQRTDSTMIYQLEQMGVYWRITESANVTGTRPVELTTDFVRSAHSHYTLDSEATARLSESGLEDFEYFPQETIVINQPNICYLLFSNTNGAVIESGEYKKVMDVAANFNESFASLECCAAWEGIQQC